MELEFAEELELDEQRARDANTAAGVDTAAKLADLRAFGESLKQAPMAHESQPLAADINAPVYQAAAPFPNEDAEPLWRPEELQQPTNAGTSWRDTHATSEARGAKL